MGPSPSCLSADAAIATAASAPFVSPTLPASSRTFVMALCIFERKKNRAFKQKASIQKKSSVTSEHTSEHTSVPHPHHAWHYSILDTRTFVLTGTLHVPTHSPWSTPAAP